MLNSQYEKHKTKTQCKKTIQTHSTKITVLKAQQQKHTIQKQQHKTQD